MNYVLKTIAVLREEVAGHGASLPDGQLTKLYAQLALTTGLNTTLEDVHQARAVWRASSDGPDDPDLVWFGLLPPETQAGGEPYRDAIRATALRMAGVRDADLEAARAARETGAHR